MGIDFYLNRITSEHRDKPKFIAWLNAALQKADDAYNCLAQFDNAFDLDNAVGKQLDILGELIGVSRILTFQPPDLSSLLDDETYRLILKAKIGKNMWQSTIPEIYDIWDGMFTDLRLDLVDNQDMSMTAAIYGVLDELRELLIANGYIIPKPSGVRLNYVGVSPVKFNPYSYMIICCNAVTTVSMSRPKCVISMKPYSSMVICGNTNSSISEV